LQEQILKGSVINQITVDDASSFPVGGGKLIFDYGKDTEEQPVSYITIPNDNTVLIDPSYEFQQDHAPGSIINVLLEDQTTPFAPARDGSDLAIYVASPANARLIVQEILKTLTAAGITIKFVILLPSYVYLFDNPYEA
jgi:hypothetical protein